MFWKTDIDVLRLFLEGYVCLLGGGGGGRRRQGEGGGENMTAELI